MKGRNIIPLLVVLIVLIIKESGQVSVEEDLLLTYNQKLNLEKFKDLVGPRLPHAYMKGDIYLIRWLRAKNFDLTNAETMLMENIRWRKDFKMDTIIEEDWTDFEKRFPYFFEGCDKEGRPVASVNVGEWDVRSAVVAGQRDKLIRYLDKLMEEVNRMVRVFQTQGKNVTQYTLLFDMGSYNLVQQGCPTCLPVFLSLFDSYESHFPGVVHKMILVNNSPIFQTLLAIIRPLMTPLTQEALVIYGIDKVEWQTALLNEIPKEHLSKAFGGIRESGLEPQEVRKLKMLPC